MLSLAIAVAAGCGAVCRYTLDQLVQHRTSGTFPLGTFVVNVTGSLLLGVVVGVSAHHHVPSDAALAVGVGFAGGYTTLSTWAWESLALAERGAWGRMTLNVAGSLAVGFAAAAAGLGLALL